MDSTFRLVSLVIVSFLVATSVSRSSADVIIGLDAVSFGEREVIPGLGRHPLTPRLHDALECDTTTWHWLPWHHTRTKFIDGQYDIAECTGLEPYDFPEDIFTPEQLLQGAIVLHFIAVVYAFSLLAIICDDYFIPTVECICEDLHLSKDVAAATFMASATSCPELFVNVMGTFITQSDLGIGTIVGSAMFNALGVAAVGSLAAIYPIRIKRWPVTRDCLIYMVNVAVLVGIAWDDRIEWYEAMILVIMYFIYFLLIFNSEKLYALAKHCCCYRKGNAIIEIESTAEIENPEKSPAAEKAEEAGDVDDESDVPDVPESLWSWPSEKSVGQKIWFVYRWPLKLLLTCTIPSPITFRFLYPLSFIMCIVLIGANSYFVSWMITVIGETFGIPDSIMGMTFLAFGGCLPEAFSIFLLSRKGKGDMGVSNSLGANSLAILFSLGIPWFAKCMALKAQGDDGYIDIASSGMNYIILSLLLVVVALYTTLTLADFMLRKLVGVVLFAIYLVFVTLAILTESGVFFGTTPPPC